MTELFREKQIMKKQIKRITKVFVLLLFGYIVVTGIIAWNRHWLILRPAQENTIFYDKNSQQYKNSEGFFGCQLSILQSLKNLTIKTATQCISIINYAMILKSYSIVSFVLSRCPVRTTDTSAFS